MKKFKKIANAVIVIFIVITVAGIIYVLQFKEKTPPLREVQKEIKKPAVKKAKVPKEKHPQPIPEERERPVKKVAIIIDDIGYDLEAVRALMKMKADLTFAILPLQAHSREAAEMLHKASKEILLHLPMEPIAYPHEKPGEGALFTDMTHEELRLQLKRDMASVPYAVGVNNHMGSKIMRDEEKLAIVFRELKKHKMFFIDSRTAADTHAAAVAEKVGLKIAERNVFIDNDHDYKQIYDNLLNIAQKNDGFPLILIGHPHPETIRALNAALKIFRDRGIRIVRVSRLIEG